MALLDKLIWQIESHLDEPLTLEVMADRCAVNRHHMCRAFQLATGLSIMGYVRARRLSAAAEDIARGAPDLLQVALGAGYGSHEAFTRAFVAELGVRPSDVKKSRDVSNLNLMEPLEMSKDMTVDVAPPKMRVRDAIRVVGFGADCQGHDISAIPGLWQRLNTNEADIAPPTGVAYGVSYDMRADGGFRYVAGVEASAVPDGMVAVDIPQARYAVFTHSGSIGDLPKTIHTIWNKALGEAGITPSPGPEFELYDKRFDPVTGRGTIEIWIPVLD
jgi:AraC family transcriptional regulator